MNLTTEFEGRLAIVTGASRGLGRAIAIELASRGAELVLLGRDRDALEESRDLAGRGTCLVHDLADPLPTEALDRVDIAVHSAAAFASFGPLETVPEDEIARVLEIGLLAVARLDRALLQGMKERGFGRLLHLSSVAARTGAHGQAAYAACKAGLEGLSRSLALEGGRHGITSNVLELGLFDTERTRTALAEGAREGLLDATAVGRAGTPEEAALAACFLTSPRSSFVTGSVLTLSGGLGLGLFGRSRP